MVRAAADTLGLSLAEAGALVALLGRSDSLEAALAEARAVLATLGRADTLDASLTETAAIAVVLAAAGFAKVTVPGPVVLDQATVSAGGAGNPSSLAVPLRVAAAGSVTVRSGPALTTGA